jgi:hypothetical protein
MNMGNTRLWKTKDGTKIRIKDMEDSHLLNTIRFLEKQTVRLNMRELDEMMSFPYPNGEMAQHAFDQEFNMIGSAEPNVHFPIYDDLVNEASRRNLI